MSRGLFCAKIHRVECLLFSGHLLAVLRSVILPSIIQINARSRVSLVKINARFFPQGVLFSLYGLAHSHLKSKFTASPSKKRKLKQKLVIKVIDPYKRKLKSCVLKYLCA